MIIENDSRDRQASEMRSQSNSERNERDDRCASRLKCAKREGRKNLYRTRKGRKKIQRRWRGKQRKKTRVHEMGAPMRKLKKP